MPSSSPRRALRALPLLVLAVAGLAAAPASAQSALRGFVRDASDGQALTGVNVAVLPLGGTPDDLAGAATNPDGFYTVAGLETGRAIVTATFVGYAAFADTLDLVSGVQQLDISLAPSTLELDQVTVEGGRAAGAADVTAGLQRIRPADVRSVPAPDVTGDLANYLTSLPGVVTAGDRGGQLFIRGGEPTQNLVLLDGIPVFQPFHVLGFYSAFPADLLQTADVYAGGYGSRYGGQLSSVLDIVARGGNKRRFGATVAASPLVSAATIEGPIVRDQASFLLSARRSLVEEIGDELVSQPLPFTFADAFGKVHYAPTPTSTLAFTGLYTIDRGAVGDPQSPRPDELRYSNSGIGFRYVLLPGMSTTMAEVTLSWSHFDSELGARSDSAGIPAGTRSTEVSRFDGGFNISYFAPSVEYRFGAFLRRMDPSSRLDGLFQGIDAASQSIVEAGVYLEPEVRLGILRVSPGLRVTLSPSLGQQFFEPRFRAVAETGAHRLSVAAGLYNQPVVGVSDRRDATSLFTVWTVSPHGRTPRAIHLLGGYGLRLSNFSLSAEGFYKRMRDLSVAEWTAYPRLTTRLQPADGEAYGGDLRAEYRRGETYAAVTYGWAQVEYAATQTRYRLWYGDETLRYQPPHDRRHQVTVIGNMPIAGFGVSARWQFGSGLPYSRALGFDVFIPPDRVPDVFEDPGQPRVIYERPFNGRLPTYHRLDLSIERTFDLGGASLTAQAGAVNLYDRTNLFAFDVFTYRRVDQLPIMPTFGLLLAFD